jgi:hypothetical protein
MNTKKTVFSKIAKGMPKKQVKLGLIDNFYTEFSNLEDELSTLSYLAYDWFDEKYEAFRDAFTEINDVFYMGAGNQITYADVQTDLDTLNEIKIKAEELGLSPEEVYPDYDRHIELIQYIKEADEQFYANKDRFDQFKP